MYTMYLRCVKPESKGKEGRAAKYVCSIVTTIYY